MSHNIHEVETGRVTPLKAVRLHCLSCCNGSANEVRLCPTKACPLWPFRHGYRPNAEDRATVAGRQVYPQEHHLMVSNFQVTALRAIRLRCLDCSGNSRGAVRSCDFGPEHRTPCDLHPYRLGRNPNIKRSDEWKAGAAERLASARAAAAPKRPVETPDLLSDRRSERGGVPDGMSRKEPALSIGRQVAEAPNGAENGPGSVQGGRQA